ncbi:Uncharacterised protein [Bordetella pertussis]|nr:Uncharacterised protein [Bordetella pertussis]CFV96776.1 Uncharacterised protein [Bordetella pertussis]CPK57773.1 Uncharacterised protein [Bordetella pertussis]CPL67612.1 Uncharacterised protein [Bordetella pertussis]
MRRAKKGAWRTASRLGFGLTRGSPNIRLYGFPPLPKSRSTPVSQKPLCRVTVTSSASGSIPIAAASSRMLRPVLM